MLSTVSTDLVAKVCGSCGVAFAIPSVLEDECRKLGPAKPWHCPNGHPRIYAKPEADELREEVARQKSLLASALSDRDRERRRADETKAALARATRRAGAGVCLHCRRSFANVRRHVAARHPEARA